MSGNQVRQIFERSAAIRPEQVSNIQLPQLVSRQKIINIVFNDLSGWLSVFDRILCLSLVDRFLHNVARNPTLYICLLQGYYPEERHAFRRMIRGKF
jgi:hypothetical protein